MGKLDGKVALVTGGSSGIGLATAKQFVAEGAHVFITGRRAAGARRGGQGDRQGTSPACGATSRTLPTSTASTPDQAEKGRLDVLFANAGVGEYAPLGKITEEHFDSIFDVNVKGLLFTVQKALPLMPDGASIILNASIARQQGIPAYSVYSATKAAVRSFARTWTTELKDRRIRVNAVSPGPIDTPGLERAAGLHRERRAAREDDRRHGATRPPRRPRRDREGRGVPRLRRQQLRHGNRAVRGWRSRTGLGRVRRRHHARR